MQNIGERVQLHSISKLIKLYQTRLNTCNQIFEKSVSEAATLYK